MFRRPVLAAVTAAVALLASSVVTAPAAHAVDGTIGGTVTTTGGAPIPNAHVQVFTADELLEASAFTEPDGTYSVPVPAGSYRVSFTADGRATRWWNGKSDFAAADPVEVTSGATTSPVDATLLELGSISGVVSDTNGPLAGIQVVAETPSGDAGSLATTDVDGSYTVADLPPGDYRVHFDGEPGHVSEWWDDKATALDATLVPVGPEQHVTGISPVLAAKATLSGTVTVPPGFDVTLVSVVAQSADPLAPGGSAVPDAGGTWSMQVVPGTYTVDFVGVGLLDQWWNGKTDPQEADPVTVGAGQVASGLNASMIKAATLSGTVTSGGEPVSGRPVIVERPDGSFVSSAITEADGTWTVGGLTAGSYRVRSEGTNGPPPEFDTWYPGTVDPAAATTVVLAEGQEATGLDIAIVRGGTVSGTVTGPGGATVSGGVVEVYLPGGPVVGTVEPDGAGNYQVAAPAGNVQVRFRGFTAIVAGTEAALDSQWFDGNTTRATANPVAVTVGGSTPDIDAQLPAGTGTMSGTVTGPGGSPLAGVWVDIEDPASFGWLGTALTSADGTYTITGVPAGDHIVRFAPSTLVNIVPEYYNDIIRRDQATIVDFTAGQSRAGIDASLATGATVSGTVTGPGGIPLPNVDVLVSDATFDVLESAQTDAAGNYSIERLPAGTFRVQFSVGSLVRWFDAQADEFTADPVVLAEAEVRGGVNMVLPGTAVLGGTVTGVDGPLSNVLVAISSVPVGENLSAFTAGNGTWATAVPAGTYTVGFEPAGSSNNDAYLPEWWDNAADETGADPVTVAAGQSRADLNAQLAAKATISGTVTTADGQPAGGIRVDAFVGPGIPSGATTTANDGTYVLAVEPGTYRLRFQDVGASATEYWDDAATLDAATPIPVAAGDAITGKDAQLGLVSVASGVLQGTVTVAGGGPAANVAVEVCLFSPEAFRCNQTMTDGSGHYVVDPAPAGTVTVWFRPPGGSNLFSTSRTATVPDSATATLDVALQTATPPPSSTSVGGIDTTDAGIPVVRVGTPFSLTTTGCVGGTASYSITNGAQTANGTLSETTPGTYSATVTLNFVGASTTTISITCPTGPPQESTFNIYIDPSGTVRDTTGAPIDGVTVTLFRADTENGAYTVVPDGSDIMSPSNRTNPDVTGADGFFQWDTVAGWYKVRAEKAGCHRPGQPGVAFAETPALPVPPPQLDLELVLACPTPPGAPTGVVAAPGDGLAAVSWQPPASDGQSPITGYTATVTPGGATCSTTGLSCTITGLSNGTTYQVVVRAQNARGTGPGSSPVSVTPTAPVQGQGAPRADTTAPSLSVGSWPEVSFTPSQPMPVSIAATDDVGVAGFRVERRSASATSGLGEWTPDPSLAATATQATASAKAGSSVCLRIQAFDAAGNASPWEARCAAVALDDAKLTASRNGRTAQWSREKRVSGAYASTLSTSKARKAELSLRSARAARVAVVVSTAPKSGKVGLYVGGRLVGSKSLASAKVVQRVVLTFATPGIAAKPGTVSVRVLKPGRTGVRIDGLALLK